jgi:hypothetical protein
MIDTQSDAGGEAVVEIQTALREVAARCAFGAGFFAGHLGALVRERCPDPREGLPSVQIHLHDGEQLDLCHVIGFAPLWVALAVWEHGSHVMRTELVQYELIARVTIGAPGEGRQGIGFDQSHVPMAVAMTPEQALRAAGVEGEGR